MSSRQLWVPDETLEREVGQHFARAIASYQANRHLVSEHANHEESIRVGGYADRTLLELVQNAADATTGADDESAGRIEIVLDPDHKVLYCANAGRPFSATGLTAIAHAHLSSKRGDEIGRFGLGFKSVLAVSDRPQVFSRSVSFEFNSPMAQAAITKIDPSAKRHPVLRAPLTVDAAAAFDADPVLADLATWAATIVRLPNAHGLDRLRQEIETFPSAFLLFAPGVREIRLRLLGSEPFETVHTSKAYGDDVYKIEAPGEEGDEWIVVHEMHAPSPKARAQVGHAVSRPKVRVSVAIPLRYSRQRRGRFWSYFPLRDQTSASALFNAPWSVNDDRTTLLPNDYNREIVATLSGVFVRALPRLSTPDDPGAHLDYMPARGREALSFGDELLCAHVPRLSADIALVPDARGELRRAGELRPLDYSTSEVEAVIHREWTESPNTGDDVPHWRCYTSAQRVDRLRRLSAASISDGPVDGDDRDMKQTLEKLPKRGLLTWLREWADGADVVSAVRAFKFVVANPSRAGIDRAKVIPTTDGLRGLADRDLVFLRQEENAEVEGAVFIRPDFINRSGVEEGLRRAGFRALDPLAILNARAAGLTSASDEEQLSKVWEAALEVPVAEAAKALARYPAAVKVPTQDGGWAWPRQVFDLEVGLGEDWKSRILDRRRCLPQVAARIGVITGPVNDYLTDDEPFFEHYRSWVLTQLNAARGAGERPIDNIELLPGAGPGPFSILVMLRDAAASQPLRESWTVQLLQANDTEWTCEDLDTGTVTRVLSPARWAVDCAGLLRTDRGYRSPSGVVAPSLLRYARLLPLFQGPRPVVDALQLPSDLAAVPASVLKEALDAQVFPPGLDDAVLAEFIEAAARIAYPGARPPNVPARVSRTIEPRPPNSVYLATTDEQRNFLFNRQRPFLHVTEEQAERIIGAVGCRRFEDSFSFSMLIEGRRSSERVVDVFTGLRVLVDDPRIDHAVITRAVQITKRVTTEDGVEDQTLDHHLDGGELIVGDDAEERQVLALINTAFDLRLNNAELDGVLKVGLDHRLEALRNEARAAASDPERLDIYFGPDDLRDVLPKGLWSALERQALVNDRTSVGDLFLTVYGSDSIRQLADLFRQEGFSDVPRAWSGGAPTISWLRRMGFGPEYAGRRSTRRPDEFVVPGAVMLDDLHDFQERIKGELAQALLERNEGGRHAKVMVELPTGSGKTRVATQTVLELFIDGSLQGPVLWIAQSQELCEQAVQTWMTVWQGLRDERPLTLGRLWDSNTVQEPDTEFGVVVATDAKLDTLLNDPEYDWLRQASAVFIDEGHRAGESERYTRILSWLGIAGREWQRPLVGLSATPFRGTSESGTDALSSRFGKRRIRAFEQDAYERLAEIDVLARVDHEVLQGGTVELHPDEIAEVRAQRRVSSAVLDRVGRDQDRMTTLVDHIIGRDPSWPVLVFTPNVISAQVLAATLRYRGVEAASVSGQTGRQERRDIIERFRRDELRVLTNCDLLIQGFDAPGVRALYIARPTFSPNAYIQMAGRGLRGPANGGKPRCLIVDVADNFGDVSDMLGYRAYEHLWQEHQA